MYLSVLHIYISPLSLSKEVPSSSKATLSQGFHDDDRGFLRDRAASTSEKTVKVLGIHHFIKFQSPSRPLDIKQLMFNRFYPPHPFLSLLGGAVYLGDLHLGRLPGFYWVVMYILARSGNNKNPAFCWVGNNKNLPPDPVFGWGNNKNPFLSFGRATTKTLPFWILRFFSGVCL